MIPILERSTQHTYGLLGKTRRHNITNSQSILTSIMVGRGTLKF